MNVTDVRNALIPKIKTFCNVPIIQADQLGHKPNGTHATYKITNAYGKDVGRASEVVDNATGSPQIKRNDSYKLTLSFSAYDLDDDISRDLAQKLHDWFDFYGIDDLRAVNVAVVELSDIVNRDAFIVENYERRNGFDVIIRIARELMRTTNTIENVNSKGNINF